jgi:hypothetical protein
MRTKLNLGSSTDRRIAGKLAVSGMTLSGIPMSGIPMSGIPVSGIPMEWLDAGSWRLPSGKALAEFALQAGFLAPPLFKEEFKAEFKAEPAGGAGRRAEDPARVKHCRKGSGQ